MSKRLLACDLDGTLLSSDGMISPRTADALERARGTDLEITLVTGRPPRWLAPVVNQSGWHGTAVSANGAVVADLDRGIVQHTFPLSTAAIEQVVTYLRSELPDVAFAVEHIAEGQMIPNAPENLANELMRSVGDPAEFGFEPHYQPRLPVAPDTRTAPLEELIGTGNVVKLLARAASVPTEDVDEVTRKVERDLEQVATVTHSTPSEVLLEISRHGVSKATGVQWLAKHHGVTRDNVIAVGDMPNDIPMLLWAGRGFAMGNAHPRVKAAVGPANVLPTHHDDGVAQLIDQLLTG